MPDNANDTLLVVAEIAVAFAGFASIVSVVGQNTRPVLPAAYRWSLRGMIACSLAVAFAALAPIAVDWFGAGARRWNVSGAALLLASTWLLIGGLRDSAIVRAESSWVARGLWLTPILFAWGIGLYSFFSPPRGGTAAWYLSGLLALLFLAGALFANIVMSQVAPRQAEDP